MKYFIFFLTVSSSFFVYAMDNQKNQGITSKLIEAFENACKKKQIYNGAKFNFDKNRSSKCDHVFVTNKFLMELKKHSDISVLESTIYLTKRDLGKIKNYISLGDNSLRAALLYQMEAIKSSAPVFGSTNLDGKTVCQNPFYQGNGEAGWVKCQTLLNK